MTRGSDPFQVTPTETGVVRIFTTDLEPQGNAAITAKNVQKLLGEGIELDPAGVEVFPSQLIESIGLTGYLTEGYGIAEEDLAGTAAALDAHAGLMILIRSSAFQGREVTLDPVAGIRFIGAFREPRNDPPKRMSKTASAEGVLEPKGEAPTAVTRGRRHGWIVAVLSLLLAAALVLFAIF